MRLKVTAPESIRRCTVDLPPSKSIANRILVMSALNGISPDKVLRRPVSTLCDDIRVLAQLLQSHDPVADVGAAGTAMRFATAYLSVTSGTRVITGTQRLRERPIGILVEALRTLGADIEYVDREGFPPLRITGNTSMRGGTVALDGSVSSQFISALLMIAPTLTDGLTLRLKGHVVSRPYISITTGLMRRFGATVEWIDDNTIAVKHGYSPTATDNDIPIEADWTASSYWYEIASIADVPSAFHLSGLSMQSLQGDKVCDSIYKKIEAMLGSGDVFEYDFQDCPDLVQTIVVNCCMLDIPFHFTGLGTLRIKETDRIAALQSELAKLGYTIKADKDSMTWDGLRSPVDGIPSIATYKDHRMAMAFAPCALKLKEIIIEDPEVVNKSYPTYWQDLEKAGFLLCYI